MATWALRAGMALNGLRYWRPLERRTHGPDAAQASVLVRLVAANRDTRFGTEHGFAGIRTARQFRDRVPIQDYETLRPYIDDQRRTGARALTAETPAFYAQTSGSTGTPKYVPITPTVLELHRREQALFSYLQHRACPRAFDGGAFGIMGAAVEDRLDTGQVVGSVSGHLYESLPRFVRSRFVVPPLVSTIRDYELKYRVLLALALARPDISYIGTPNPSTFLRLADVLEAERDVLLDGLENGRFDWPDDVAVDPVVRRVVETRLRPQPARAAALRRLPTLTFARVWPDIRLLTTWTGGSCGIALARLRSLLPTHVRVMELGYQATECRGTLPLEAETSSGVPPLHHVYLEFAEQAAWEDGRRATLELAGLEAGRRYYVVITTVGGLYRYAMNDVVEVTGFHHRTPLLRFVQKGRGVTSLTGEKLYEGQVIDAVQAALCAHRLMAPFFVCVADEDTSGYRLYVEVDAGSTNGAGAWSAEALAAAIDRELRAVNREYQSKRASRRLAPLSVARLRRGAAHAYKAACVRAGQREGQFKPAVLLYARDLKLPVYEYVIDEQRGGR